MMNTDNDVELIDIENKVNDVLIMRTGFHNRYISRCKVIGVKPLDKIINYVRPFADLDKETNKGLKLLMKSFSGEYPGKVNTEELLSDRVHWSLVDLDSEVRKNLTRREEFIQVLELIHDLKTNKTAYVGDVAARKLEDISKTHEFETDIYRNLGIDKITSLDFNKTKIKAAMKKAKASFNK
jgi:hypothetical protein